MGILSSLAWVFALVAAVWVLSVAIWHLWLAPRSQTSAGATAMRTLLVIAHPDDECMFFSPSLTSGRLGHVSVLCLSTGNADGLGEVRKRELVASCAIFGITDVQSVDHPDLQDGFHNDWPSSVVQEAVLSAIRRTKCDNIVTFDSHGVSGHPNHIAVYRGVRDLVNTPQGASLRAWSLVSVPLVRKYTGVIDAVLTSTLLRRGGALVYTSSVDAVEVGRRAMTAHASQLVWFRHIFILISRFMFVNELLPIR